MARKKTDPWHGPAVARALAVAFSAPLIDGRVDAHVVARACGVTAQTVRRWQREGLPKARQREVGVRVLPTLGDLEQERREFEHALAAEQNLRWALEKPRRKVRNPEWLRNGWDTPHVLALVEIPRWGVIVPRISIPGEGAERRLCADGGRIVDEALFPTRFAARVGKGVLLSFVSRWRLVLPVGEISRGRTQTWHKEAPRHRLEWLVANLPIKPRRVRPLAETPRTKSPSGRELRERSEV